jgi:signal transduction histidine kinase
MGALESVDGSTEAERALERIVSDGKRAGQVIGRVRSLLKRQAPRKDWLDVNETIHEVVALTQDQARRHDVTLRVGLADGLPPIRGARVQLQQVLIKPDCQCDEAMSGTENTCGS